MEENQSIKRGVDYIGISICYFCHDGAGNFVMMKRSNNTRDEHGRWDIGGGALEFGETVEQRLRAEIKEEYCVDVLDYEFLGYREAHRSNQNKETHWITIDFKVLVDRDKVKNGEPHKFDELAWFTLDNLPLVEEMHSQLPIFFKNYKAKL